MRRTPAQYPTCPADKNEWAGPLRRLRNAPALDASAANLIQAEHSPIALMMRVKQSKIEDGPKLLRELCR
jgi:hypothetical protein